MEKKIRIRRMFNPDNEIKLNIPTNEMMRNTSTSPHGHLVMKGLKCRSQGFGNRSKKLRECSQIANEAYNVGIYHIFFNFTSY